LGLTKPALHYHFAGKAELGEALIDRYAARFADALERIDRERLDGRGKLEAYIDLYRRVLAEQRMCLCGMLAADYGTLPEAMRDGVVRFFDANDTWLARTLEEGREEGTLRFSGTGADLARMIVATLEGAMLVARPFDDVGRFDAAVARLLIGLATEPSAT
jgi:TetR/AcrR family transcriptional repressor of nem operon